MSQSDIAISIRGLSKAYSIAHQGNGRRPSFRDAVMDRLRHPFRKGSTETFWALKDVSFDVQKGDVVGIIGRNGAGKSTLLKILSRITKPTSGEIDVYGRVGSLLEVGTGFHPELTGRENIFLNGAILGMRRAEIRKQYDAIVDFAEVEQFLDTPVKRYSSGMYVRLAFAVAAHLNPEILIIDEVLAVGDADFQRKCLGKMGEAAQGGRTVLFVSHNMQAIAQLTRKCLILVNGSVQFLGTTEQAIPIYERGGIKKDELVAEYCVFNASEGCFVKSALVNTSMPVGVHVVGKPLEIEFLVHIDKPRPSLCFSCQIIGRVGQPICHFWLFDNTASFRHATGDHRVRFQIPSSKLFIGTYTLTTWLSDKRGDQLLETRPEICRFNVIMGNVARSEYEWREGDCAYLEDFQATSESI